ncbi:MAG: hypothetical protein ACLFQ5_06535 [Oceanicaulis sp.]
MGRLRLFTRFAALGGVLTLAACSAGGPGAAPNVSQGFTAAPAAAASTAGTASNAAVSAAPGYALAGASFSGLIEFEDQAGRPLILYQHAVDGAPNLVAELDPARNWLSDGVRRFEGVSDRGVPVSVELVSGACRANGRTYARFARVQAGRLSYEGCARETGPSVRWSEQLPRYAEPIAACLDAARQTAMATVRAAGPARILHARNEAGAPVIRFQFGETGRWDCRAEPRRPQWRVVADAAPALPGEGDPVYAPGAPPEAGEGCYLWEQVRGPDGGVIGALGEDVCASGTGAPPPVTGFP